jgi:hypothetical protein
VVNSEQNIVDLHILRTSFCQRSNVSHRQNSLLYDRRKELVFSYEEVVIFQIFMTSSRKYVKLAILLSRIVPLDKREKSLAQSSQIQETGYFFKILQQNENVK